MNAQRMPHTQLLAVTAVVIVVAELFANVLDVGGNDDGDASVGGWIGLSLWGIALAALLLLVVLPRVDRAAWPTLSLVFGVTALITVVAFWSALPFAFGAAAFAAAPRLESAGAILGIVAAVIAFVFCIIG